MDAISSQALLNPKLSFESNTSVAKEDVLDPELIERTIDLPLQHNLDISAHTTPKTKHIAEEHKHSPPPTESAQIECSSQESWQNLSKQDYLFKVLEELESFLSTKNMAVKKDQIPECIAGISKNFGSFVDDIGDEIQDARDLQSMLGGEQDEMHPFLVSLCGAMQALTRDELWACLRRCVFQLSVVRDPLQIEDLVNSILAFLPLGEAHPLFDVNKSLRKKLSFATNPLMKKRLLKEFEMIIRLHPCPCGCSNFHDDSLSIFEYRRFWWHLKQLEACVADPSNFSFEFAFHAFEEGFHWIGLEMFYLRQLHIRQNSVHPCVSLMNEWRDIRVSYFHQADELSPVYSLAVTGRTELLKEVLKMFWNCSGAVMAVSEQDYEWFYNEWFEVSPGQECLESWVHSFPTGRVPPGMSVPKNGELDSFRHSQDVLARVRRAFPSLKIEQSFLDLTEEEDAAARRSRQIAAQRYLALTSA